MSTPLINLVKGPVFQLIRSYLSKVAKFKIAQHSFQIQKAEGFSLSTYQTYNLIKRSIHIKQNKTFNEEIYKKFKDFGITEFTKQDFQNALCLSIFKEVKTKVFYLNETEINSIFSIFLQVNDPKILYISTMGEMLAYDCFNKDVPNAVLIVNVPTTGSTINFYSMLKKYADKIYYLRTNGKDFDIYDMNHIKYLSLDCTQGFNPSKLDFSMKKVEFLEFLDEKGELGSKVFSKDFINSKYLACNEPNDTKKLITFKTSEMRKEKEFTVDNYPLLENLLVRGHFRPDMIKKKLKKILITNHELDNNELIPTNCESFSSDFANIGKLSIKNKIECPLLKKLRLKCFPFTDISIPNIQCLNLTLYNEDDLTNLIYFLKNHSSTIRKLYLTFENNTKKSKEKDKIFTFPFRNLQKLKLKNYLLTLSVIKLIKQNVNTANLKKIKGEFSLSEKFKNVQGLSLDLPNLESLQLKNVIGSEKIVEGLTKMNFPKLRVLRMDINCPDEEFVTQCLVNSSFKNSLEVLSVNSDFKIYLDTLYAFMRKLRYINHPDKKSSEESLNYYSYEKIIIEISDPSTKYEEKKCLVF